MSCVEFAAVAVPHEPRLTPGQEMLQNGFRPQNHTELQGGGKNDSFKADLGIHLR